MDARKWLKCFFILSISLLGVVAFLNIYIDPYKTLGWSKRINFTSDRNGRFSKIQKMKESSGVKRLIVGSSRSEFFFPEDMERVLGGKTFSASIGSSYTYTKYAFALKGVELLRDLEEIVFVSDFYEFNKKEIPWLLHDLEIFNPMFSAKFFDDVRPAKFRLFKSLISKQLTTVTLKTLKEVFKGKKQWYREDGTTTTSMVISNFENLNKEIRKTSKIYHNDHWKSYTELSDLSKLMINDLLALSASKDIKIKVILSPLHPVLLAEIQEEKELVALWDEWISYWNSTKQDNVDIFNFSNSDGLFEASPENWKDGIHFSRKASVELIKLMVRR